MINLREMQFKVPDGWRVLGNDEVMLEGDWYRLSDGNRPQPVDSYVGKKVSHAVAKIGRSHLKHVIRKVVTEPIKVSGYSTLKIAFKEGQIVETALGPRLLLGPDDVMERGDLVEYESYGDPFIDEDPFIVRRYAGMLVKQLAFYPRNIKQVTREI